MVEVSLDTLEWRSIGPYRGGRVEAVSGDYSKRGTFYFGSGGGGVWKTTDGGLYWRNVSDGFFKRASVGAIAVAPSDSNVVYVGMGEACIRNNVSHGDGVYRSTDGGRTWRHLGLASTRHIARIRVDPRDPDTVFVAALGHAHGPHPDRGIYRSRDGGATWQNVLWRGPSAGAIDLTLDPTNPRILYAAMWEAVRLPHQLISGGPSSGLFKSIDNGEHWDEITRNAGLPSGILGRMGIAVSPAQPDRVYALIEAAERGVYRSDDGGRTWVRGSDDHELLQRPFYFTHIFADPLDSETVWVLNFDAYRSPDAGHTFSIRPTTHPDNHDLWIDPQDPLRMINGNDGGASVSFDGGLTWSTLYNQPTGEIYHITADTRVPYRVYGAQQDSTSISVPSRSGLTAITWGECYSVGGGEAGYIAVRADNPDVVYAATLGGTLTRYDHRSGQIRVISVWPDASPGIPAQDLKYRFNWTAPVVLSPHSSDVLYTCSQYVHRTRDEGTHWECISPDLTLNDRRTTGDSGGPVTTDNVGAEYYATIFTFSESPRERGVLWAGSDDGLIHVSRDDGQNWHNVTPSQLEPFTLMSMIEPGQHDPAVAYVAATRYKLDDFKPYIYRTADLGQTWTQITDGIPVDDFTRVIREDPEVPGLLYAGTETGLYVSFDNGANWQRWQGTGLPVVPIHDLLIKDGDLCLASHGRGFWIFDDITPVRELARQGAGDRVGLFTRAATVRYKTYHGWAFRKELAPLKSYHWPGGTGYTSIFERDPTGQRVERNLDAGTNPPDGVLVSYYLPRQPAALRLTFFDPAGRAIRSFSAPSDDPNQPKLPMQKGLNRFVYDMRGPPATGIVDDPLMEQMESGLKGPVAPPGTYTGRIEADAHQTEASFQIAQDPRLNVNQADLEAQFYVLLELRDLLDRTHQMVNRVRQARAEHAVSETAGGALDAIEGRLMQPLLKGRLDHYQYGVRLNNRIAALIGSVSSADAAPTQQQRELTTQLGAEVQAVSAELEAALEQARRTHVGE
jgi:photosystem II stability/assembly factor-like uncharacterized protein